MNVFEDNPALPKKRGNLMLTNLISNYDDLKGQHLEDMVKQIEVGQSEVLDDDHKKSLSQRVYFYLNLANPKEWLLLLFYSVVVTSFIIIIDTIAFSGLSFRHTLLNYSNFYVGSILYIITAIFFSLIATSMGYFITPNSDGSGIPELKVVLSGLNLYHFYDFKALVGKTIGLISVLIAGLELGRAGTYIHIAAVIGKQILKLNYFESIKESSKRMILVVSAAAGVTLSLGTPLGGIILAIEQSSTVFLVTNVWKCFFVAIFCIFTRNIIKDITHLTVNNIDGGYFKPVKFDYQTLFFILLGILSGLICSLFNIIFGKVAYTRRISKNKYYNNRFWYIAIVGTICALCQIILPPLRASHPKQFSILFSPNHVSKMILEQEALQKNLTISKNITNIATTVGEESLEHEYFDNTSNTTKTADELSITQSPFLSLLHPNEGYTLLICFLVKLVLVTITNTANIPLGVIGPILIMGGFFGRLYGHVLYILLDIREEYVFSLVGAACFLSGCTHSIAPAVIIYEITGENSYLVHLLLATLISNLICQSLCVSIFDVILFMRNLPFIATVKSAKLYSYTTKELKDKISYYLKFSKSEFAIDITDENFESVSKKLSFNNTAMMNKRDFEMVNIEENNNQNEITFDSFNIISALCLLLKIPEKFYYNIPVIDEENFILFTITPKRLFFYVEKEIRNNFQEINPVFRTKLKELMTFLKSKYIPSQQYYYEKLIYKFKKIFFDINESHKHRLDKMFLDESMFRIKQKLKAFSLQNKNSFLNNKIDEFDKLLDADRSFLSLDTSFSALKLQYFFTFMSVSHVFITEKGKLVGIIGKEDFIKKSINIS